MIVPFEQIDNLMVDDKTFIGSGDVEYYTVIRQGNGECYFYSEVNNIEATRPPGHVGYYLSEQNKSNIRHFPVK